MKRESTESSHSTSSPVRAFKTRAERLAWEAKMVPCSRCKEVYHPDENGPTLCNYHAGPTEVWPRNQVPKPRTDAILQTRPLRGGIGISGVYIVIRDLSTRSCTCAAVLTTSDSLCCSDHKAAGKVRTWINTSTFIGEWRRRSKRQRSGCSNTNLPS